MPGVGVTAARQRLEFRIGLAAERGDFFGRGASAPDLSYWQFDEAARLTVNPQGSLTATATAQYTRSFVPRNYEPLGLYMRDVVAVGAAAAYRTPRGRYELGLNYDFVDDWFENDQLAYANTLRHTARLIARKAVSYRLQLSAEVAVGHLGHDRVSSALAKADSTPLTVTVGATGAMGPRLTGTLKLGYVNGFYDERPNLQNENLSRPVAEAEAAWQVIPFTARLSGGYAYQAQDAIIGNFYVDNLIYLRYDHLLAVPRFHAVTVSAKPAYRYRSYHGEPQGFAARADHILQLQTAIELPIKPWLLIGAGYDLSADLTDFRDPTGITYRFVKHEVYLKTQVAY
jgi:hypothetical protein